MRAKNLRQIKRRTEVVKFENDPRETDSDSDIIMSRAEVGVSRDLYWSRDPVTRSASASPVRRSRPCIQVTERSEVEKALNACEEHTSWVNDVLKQRMCQPISDLCRSVGDGLTLVNLVEILTNEQIPDINNKPLHNSQKADNIHNTLRHLAERHVDTHGIVGYDLVEGNLKSTLGLMNNLRRRYETHQANSPRGPSLERDVSPGLSARPGPTPPPLTRPGPTPPPPARPGPTPPPGRPGPNTVRFAADTPPAPPLRATTPTGFSSKGCVQRARTPDTAAPGADIIPGVVAEDIPPSRPPPPDSIPQSAAEVNKHDGYHNSNFQGGNTGLGHSSSNFVNVQSSTPPVVTHAWSHDTTLPSGGPQPMVHTTQIRHSRDRSHDRSHDHSSSGSRDHRNNTHNRSVPPSLRPRGIINGAYEYDDGELIVPPAPRDTEIGQLEQHLPQTSGYVPSRHPETTPDKPRTPVPGHSVLPTYHPPPQYHHPSHTHTATSQYHHPSPTQPTGTSQHHNPAHANPMGTPQHHHSSQQQTPEISQHPNPSHTHHLQYQHSMQANPTSSRPHTPNAGPQAGHPHNPPVHKRTTHSPARASTPNPGPQTGHSHNPPVHNRTTHSPARASTPNQLRQSSHLNESGRRTNNNRVADKAKSNTEPRLTRAGPPPTFMSSGTSPWPSPVTIPSSVTITMVNTHQSIPANGRASPQGQSSTPASQSPNHDQSCSSPRRSQQNYVNINNLGNTIKDGHNEPAKYSQEVTENGNVRTQESPMSSEQLLPSSVYPVSVAGHAAADKSNRVDVKQYPYVQSPHTNKRSTHSNKVTLQSPRVHKRVDQSPQRTQQSPHTSKHRDIHLEGRSQTPVHMHSGHVTPRGEPIRPGSVPPEGVEEGIYSIIRKRVGHSEMTNRNSWSPLNQAGTNERSNKLSADLELQQLPARPASRAGPLPDADLWDSDDSSETPPLPPLSPADTPPVTPPANSPKARSPRHPHTATYPTNRTPGGLEVNSKPAVARRKGRRSGSSARSYDTGWRRSGPGRGAYRPTYKHRNHSAPRVDRVEGSTTAVSEGEDWEDLVSTQEVRQLKQQMAGLETMYAEVLRLVGADRDYLPAGSHLPGSHLPGTHLPGSRHSVSSTSSLVTAGGLRPPRSQPLTAQRTAKEIKSINKRFSRLEAHVVTLARSVAHLSSEMRTQNGLYQELEEIKHDLRQLKKERHSAHSPGGATEGQQNTEFEKFRGWIPSISNPKRVRKLAKFFGEDRMLHYFLEKLGYQKYIKNFRSEEITILELPYMNEARLEKLGIPMGPRQRILQEAQMCFRQENFNIYIV